MCPLIWGGGSLGIDSLRCAGVPTVGVVMDKFDNWLRRTVRALRKQASVKRWKPGMPIRDIICWKEGGWGMVCQQVHGGYHCAACNTIWLLPKSHKTECTCGARVEVYADWEAFYEDLRRREEAVCHQHHRMKMGTL